MFYFVYPVSRVNKKTIYIYIFGLYLTLFVPQLEEEEPHPRKKKKMRMETVEEQPMTICFAHH